MKKILLIALLFLMGLLFYSTFGARKRVPTSTYEAINKREKGSCAKICAHFGQVEETDENKLRGDCTCKNPPLID